MASPSNGSACTIPTDRGQPALSLDLQSTLSQLLLSFLILPSAGLYRQLKFYSLLLHAIYNIYNVPKENPLGAIFFLVLSLTPSPIYFFFFFFAFGTKNGIGGY